MIMISSDLTRSQTNDVQGRPEDVDVFQERLEKFSTFGDKNAIGESKLES